jgi:histidinol-phosphate phosphatase family protein
MTNKTTKAIFLDRDGTIIWDKNYLASPSDIEYYPDTLSALKLMIQKGYKLYIITNQSGVGRGYFTLKTVEEIHRVIDQDLVSHGLPAFSGWGICPHAPDENCSCRKPSPKLILEFMKKDKIDPKNSWMVGDKLIDAECGIKASIRGALVRESSLSQTTEYPFFKTLLEFAQSLAE